MLKFVASSVKVLTIAFSIALCVSGCSSDDEKVSIPELKPGARLPVAIVECKVLSSNELQRLANHVSWQFSCEVITRTLQPDEKDTESVEHALLALVAPDASKASYALGLVDAGDGKLADGARIAIVDVAPKVDASEADAHEVHLRRVERFVISALADLLDIQSCPMPHCVLFPVTDLKGLDQKGRGFCPPCQQRAEGLLESKGIKPLSVDAE